jgi:hypothetical protein
MKHVLLTACLLSLMSTTFAQDEAAIDAAVEGPWKKGGIAGLNFSQTYLSNWQGGGNNAINGTAILSLYANYAQDKWTWDNTFDAAYGQTLIGRLDDGAQFQKTDDRIEINSKVGHTTPVLNVYWAALATFRTQWDAGYDYGSTTRPLISDPFSPGYFLLGTGVDYKPSEGFSAYLSPLTAKVTIVDNQRLANAGAYGVAAAEYDPTTGALITEGENIRYEIGGYLKLAYQKDLMKNVKLTTKADFFANYLQNAGNIDVNWETLIAMKINKFLTASLSTHLIYDDDINIAVDRTDNGKTDDPGDGFGPRIQFKEVFSLGLSYQF